VTNAHFGNLGDIWKHIVLAEALAREHPHSYWETHAGSASYRLGHSPARDYGIYYLLDNGQRSSRVARSAYWEELARFCAEEANSYPGSALLAMRLLHTASYVLCDLDEASIRTLAVAACSLGLEDQVQLRLQDGLATLRKASGHFTGDPGDAFAHIDPFDPFAETQPGLSALSLAGLLGSRGFKLIYWYGYDSPEQRTWPWATLATQGRSAWCGDLIARSNLTSSATVPMSDISPLIGCGVVAINLSDSTTAALASLGDDLVSLYEGASLPHTSTSGSLDFLELAAAPVG
jgi:23S rRNA (adenine2030-N6)-methyltransferase